MGPRRRFPREPPASVGAARGRTPRRRLRWSQPRPADERPTMVRSLRLARRLLAGLLIGGIKRGQRRSHNWAAPAQPTSSVRPPVRDDHRFEDEVPRSACARSGDTRTAASAEPRRSPAIVVAKSSLCRIWSAVIRILPDRTSSTRPNGRTSEMKLSSFSLPPVTRRMSELDRNRPPWPCSARRSAEFRFAR